MNDGELKAIIEDFVQIRKELYLKLDATYDKAGEIASRIVAAKITNGDYKGKNFYHDKNVGAEYKRSIETEAEYKKEI